VLIFGGAVSIFLSS